MSSRILGSLIGPVVALLIAIIGGAHYLGKLEERIDGLNIKKIKEAQEEALEEIEKIASGVLDPLPPGTIIASVLKPELFLTNGREQKWRLADASSIPPNCEYSNILQNNDVSIASTDRLPDLRGVFLRGLNAGRNDGNQDPDGNNRLAGTYQSTATKLPNTPFTGTADVSGEHQHGFDVASTYSAGAGNHTRAKHRGRKDQTAEAGEHQHQVTITAGGDNETRPANISVYFYIKIN